MDCNKWPLQPHFVNVLVYFWVTRVSSGEKHALFPHLAEIVFLHVLQSTVLILSCWVVHFLNTKSPLEALALRNAWASLVVWVTESKWMVFLYHWYCDMTLLYHVNWHDRHGPNCMSEEIFHMKQIFFMFLTHVLFKMSSTLTQHAQCRFQFIIISVYFVPNPQKSNSLMSLETHYNTISFAFFPQGLFWNFGWGGNLFSFLFFPSTQKLTSE